MAPNITQNDFFTSSVFIADKPEFLTAARTVAMEYLKEVKATAALDPFYPVQTNGIAQEPILSEFNGFIAQTAWEILDSQGYAVDKMGTYIREMWVQEHNQNQGHDEHVHGLGDQISGVYIIDCPDMGSALTIHDPRPGKLQINLAEKNRKDITDASPSAVLVPKEGRFFFFNSWLPHSLTRSTQTAASRLVHFNLTVGPLPEDKTPAAIVV